MTGDAHDRLLVLSARLADGEAIDWERARRELPPDRVERLAELAAMFAAMRSIGAHEKTAEPGKPRGETERSVHETENPEAGQSEGEAGKPGTEASESGIFKSHAGVGSWGHLHIVAPLARGGFGVVYRAFDPVLQREVALKLRRLDAAGAAVGQPDVAWIREARRLASVRHPNVLAVHGADVHEANGHGPIPGLWSDLVEGETLRDRVKAGRLDPSQLLSVARQLAAAVGAVHAAGIVHGDIKPSNIMVEPGDRIVLMDFGAGRELASCEAGPAVVGSPLVMAPECLSGSPASFGSDIYALGAVLHYAASGRYPVEAERLSDLTEALDSGIRVDLSGTAAPGALRRLIATMLNADPARRPAIGEVAAEIERIRQAPARRWRIAAVSAIIALLVAGLTVTAIGYVSVRAADAETAAVNDFLRELLAAPRGSEAGREVRVVDLLARALPEAERRYADQPGLRARIQALVGRTYVSLGNYAAAEPLLREAYSVHADRFGEHDSRTVGLLDPIARAELELGSADKAERTWQRMLESSDVSEPDGRVNAITARIGLALLAQRGNRLGEAEATLREAAGLGGPSGTEREALRARMLLSDVLGRAGQLEEADAIAADALERSLQLNGERHVNTLAARHNLVVSRYERADFVSAEPLARENLAVAMDWLGPLDQTTITAQADLSNVLHARGELEASLSLLEAAIKAAEQVYEAGASEPMTLRVNLVARYLDMQRYEDAVAMALTNADVLGRFPAPSGGMPLVNGINLAEGYFRLGRYDDALEQARSMQQAVTEAFGARHTFARVAEGFAGASLSRLGRHAEAGEVLGEAHAALAETLGEPHPLTLDLAAVQAENLLALGRAAAALELARNTHAGLLAVYPETHFKVTDLGALIERIEVRSDETRLR